MIGVWAFALLPLVAEEGPLNNDAFLPVSRPATEALVRGDELWATRESSAASVASAEAERSRATSGAFEAWRSALTLTKTGESVAPRGGSVDGSRWTVGVEEAVLERLLELSVDERAAWSERFGALARVELESAGFAPHLLAGVERRNPGTHAATAACIALADLELEAGSPHYAGLWCVRGRRHAELVRAPALAEALAAREEAVRSLASDPDEEQEAPWTRAARIEFVERLELVNSSEVFRSTRIPRPVGITPGLAFLEDGRIAAQLRDRVVVVGSRGRAVQASFKPSELLPVAVRIPAPRHFAADPRHWPLLPVSAGSDVLIVHGRGTPGSAEPNALLRLRPPGPVSARRLSRDDLPSLTWAVVGDILVSEDGGFAPDERYAGFGSSEFQPGPVVVGSRILAQVRQYEGDVRASLACFDLATGRPRWVRLLAQGSGLPGSAPRAGSLPRDSLPGQPLAVVGDAVFVGTQVGAGALVEVLDGRVLWSVKNRRRTTGTNAWATNAKPAVAPAGDGRVIVWAPQDSDRLYWLHGRATARGEEPLAREPVSIGEAMAFATGDGDEALVFARSGARRVFSSWRTATGARHDSPFLGREETFAGTAAISDHRVAFSSDRGLYYLDRERELYLLDYRPLAPGFGSESAGGSVHASGDRLFVLDRTTLWVLSAVSD